ncbi:MAG: hypothetical protein QXY45_02750 [Candidatus Aenigmatarchaeota archaeon]
MRLISLFIILLFLPPIYSQISVGISPSILDLGEINPGETKIGRFYAVTSSKEKIIVYLGVKKGDIRILNRSGYENSIKYCSEEDVSSWVKFINNPAELLPTEKIMEKTKSGFDVEQLREVVFILEVPKTAEPGYHTGTITMDPISAKAEKSDISVKSIVPINFIFKVKGEPIRSGKIIDIVHTGYSFDRRWIQVFYQNNGTVTTFVKNGAVKFLDENGKVILEKSTDSDYVKPDEIKEFNTFIEPNELKDGDYNVTVSFDYTTGYIERNLTLKIGFTQPATGKIVKEKKISWILFIILLLAITSYIIYRCWS